MKIKELRKKHKLNQTQIANILNIEQTTYSGYELGKHEPSIETLKKLADYYNVSLDYLLQRDFNKEIGDLTQDQIEFVVMVKKLNDDNFLVLKGFTLSLLKQQGEFNA